MTSLEVLYGVDTGIRLDQLHHLSRLVAEETGVTVPVFKPVTGGFAFLKNMPGDVKTCIRDGISTFPPISGCVYGPVVGGSVSWVWDSLATSGMVRQLASSLGFEVAEEDVDRVRARLDEALASITAFPRWLTAEQTTDLVRETLAAPTAEP